MSLPFQRLPSFLAAHERTRDRLRQSLAIYVPLIALISSSLCLTLTGHLLPAINPRLGNPAEVISLHSDGQPGDIYLSISPDGDQLTAFDSNRRIARWSIRARSLEEVKPLTRLIEQNVRESLLTSSLFNRALPFQTRVVLSVDQHLRYFHIKPVLYALAEARVSNYAFEVRRPEHSNTHASTHAINSIVSDKAVSR